MELSFFDICILQAIAGAEIKANPDWSKKVFKPINIDFAFRALQKLAIFRYEGLEFKAVS